MTKNKALQAAKNDKKDEFYTQLTDIEKEMTTYQNFFFNQVIFMNCDDGEKSHFWQYFYKNFHTLKLQKIIGVSFAKKGSAQKFTYGGRGPVQVVNLLGDGDFRSSESVEILEEADIVVTNPPFSLFREYIAQLMKHKKKFIILGNMNAITYKEIFPLIKDNLMWYGESIRSGDREFQVPEHYPIHAAGFRIDEDKNRFIRVKGVRWFTNLDTPKRHTPLVLKRSYKSDPSFYQKYDNYDAINVNKTLDIPFDYEGVMGVPITFLDKYNPEQFEIVGSRRWGKSEELLKLYRGTVEPPENDKKTLIDGRETYDRIFIKKK